MVNGTRTCFRIVSILVFAHKNSAQTGVLKPTIQGASERYAMMCAPPVCEKLCKEPRVPTSICKVSCALGSCLSLAHRELWLLLNVRLLGWFVAVPVNEVSQLRLIRVCDMFWTGPTSSRLLTDSTQSHMLAFMLGTGGGAESST